MPEIFQIFYKYERRYIARVTGYDIAQLSKIATGEAPLERLFIDLCCSKLGESEEELFGPPSSKEDEPVVTNNP